MINKDYLKALVDEAVYRLQQNYEIENIANKKSVQEYHKYLNETKENYKVNKTLLERKNDVLRKEYNKMNKELFGNEHFIETPEDYEYEIKNKKYKSFEDILNRKYIMKRSTETESKNISRTKLKNVNSLCSKKKKPIGKQTINKKDNPGEKPLTSGTDVSTMNAPKSILYDSGIIDNTKVKLLFKEIEQEQMKNANVQKSKKVESNIKSADVKKFIAESDLKNTKNEIKNTELSKNHSIFDVKKEVSLQSKLSLRPVKEKKFVKIVSLYNDKKTLPKELEKVENLPNKENKIISDQNVKELGKKSRKESPSNEINNGVVNKDKSFIVELTQKTDFDKVTNEKNDQKESIIKEGSIVGENSKVIIQDKSGAYEMLDKFKMELLMDKGNSPVI